MVSLSNSKKPKRILVFSREAGGAAALAPLCTAMIEEGWKLLILSKDYAKAVFDRYQLAHVEFLEFTPENVTAVIKSRWEELPDLILTSATSLPQVDMTEKYLWQWAKEQNIPSIGMLDQWQNYALRFSGTKEGEHLAFLPDYIFAMDDFARSRMVEEGISCEKIVVAGQPAFDVIREKYVTQKIRFDTVKDQLGISSQRKVITFAAEALKKDFQDCLGYDEQLVLQFLGNTLNAIAGNSNLSVDLIVKLHPQNKKDDFLWVDSQWPHLKKHIVDNEYASWEMIGISDVVAGMASVMLLEALLMEKIVISLQLNSQVPSQLVATYTGAIPFIHTEPVAEKVLQEILLDEKVQEEYRQTQKKWQVPENAVLHCMNFLRSVLGGEYARSLGW